MRSRLSRQRSPETIRSGLLLSRPALAPWADGSGLPIPRPTGSHAAVERQIAGRRDQTPRSQSSCMPSLPLLRVTFLVAIPMISGHGRPGHREVANVDSAGGRACPFARDPCAKHLATTVLAWHGLAVNVLVEAPSRPRSQAGDMPDLPSHRRSRRFKSGHLPRLVAKIATFWLIKAYFPCPIARRRH